MKFNLKTTGIILASVLTIFTVINASVRASENANISGNIDRNPSQHTPNSIKAKISGKLSNSIKPGTPGAADPVYQTACNQIEVYLRDWKTGKTIASTKAAGGTISNGCTYELNTSISIANPYSQPGGQKLTLAALGNTVGNYAIVGFENIMLPVSSQVNVTTYAKSQVPR